MSALNDDELVEAVAAMSDDDLVAAAAFDGDPAFIVECERRDRKMMAEAGAETVAALRDDLARITAIRIVTGELDPVAPDGDSYSLTDDAQTALKWLLAMAMMPGPSEGEALRDALARDAQVREEADALRIERAACETVHSRDMLHDRFADAIVALYPHPEVAAMLRDGAPADDSDIMPGSEFDGPVIL